MSGIDPYSLSSSLNNALIPDPSLIDGRTRQDRLCFLADFASLINFYDHENQIKGTWEPFILKDPVFLLASISKTRFSEIHTLYLETCHKLSSLINQNNKSELGGINPVAAAFNELFDQLNRVFMCIKRWIYFMVRSDESYDLKTYVTEETTNSFSAYFWALNALRHNLSSVIKDIEFTDPFRYYLFDHYEKKIWQENKDKSPYWEILSLNPDIRQNTDTDFFNAITRIGDTLFKFFRIIIQHASADYNKLSNKRSQYPDTTLLRTFVELLQIQQEQLNGITQKHLQFYYKDILKQNERTAVPDSVYLFAELAKTDAVFILPANTPFSAGLDQQKNPIVFENTDVVSLNPAAITEAFTLSYASGLDSLNSLYLQKIAAPSALQKDTNGMICSWPTFGGPPAATATEIKPVIVFASPMLLLREGGRTITLTIEYTGTLNREMLNVASWYLSTQTDWVLVKASLKTLTPITNIAVVEIDLDEKQPPIEAFLKNPDGLQSAWPMLKIGFNGLADPSSPPIINALTINVKVSDFKTFQLYNDNGALSTKTPYQLFGPAPLLNSSFLIGSNEIFSKPLDDFSIDLDWNNLPDDFESYYAQYNAYLTKKKSLLKRAINALYKITIKWWLDWFKNDEDDQDDSDQPFNNCSFKVNFQILQNHNWQDFDMHKKTTCIKSNGKPADNAKPDTCTTPTAETLFATDNTGKLSPKSSFAYEKGSDKIIDDPGIQNAPLKFTDDSQYGFVKMELCDPVYGFGMDIYPAVVYKIALDNAVELQKWFDKKFKQTAVLPFAPKLTELVAGYTASKRYTFNPAADGYPLECYLYNAFEKYKVYDGTQGPIPGLHSAGAPDPVQGTAGVPLFPAFDYRGYLYLGLDNLVSTTSLSIYFDLAGKYETNTATNGNSGEDESTGYFYLSTNGWKPLSLLSDGTNNFTCSGLIKVSIPGDITNQGPLMPDNKYWIAIGVKTDPASFSDTVLVKTNAFRVQRTGSTFLLDSEPPALAANVISKPQNAIPQIATLLQPFPSFGGRGAENETLMNRRVSARIKTKDRAVTAGDYFTLISQQFNDIYFSKPVFDKANRKTGIYVVRSYGNWTDANAFIPLVTDCQEIAITNYLKTKTSALADIYVSNFDMQYVKVTCIAMIKTGFECQGMQKTINQLLNIYLSPWIKSDTPQIRIDQPVSEAQVAKFIKSIVGVSDVLNVSFQSWMKAAGDMSDSKAAFKESVQPATPTALMISYMNHDIQCIAV